MVLQYQLKTINLIKVSKYNLPELITLTISTFISVIFFVFGFLLGERQSKTVTHDVGDEVAEIMLDALQLHDQGNIGNTQYNRNTRNFEMQNPNSTTSK